MGGHMLSLYLQNRRKSLRLQTLIIQASFAIKFLWIKGLVTALGLASIQSFELISRDRTILRPAQDGTTLLRLRPPRPLPSSVLMFCRPGLVPALVKTRLSYETWVRSISLCSLSSSDDQVMEGKEISWAARVATKSDCMLFISVACSISSLQTASKRILESSNATRGSECEARAWKAFEASSASVAGCWEGIPIAKIVVKEANFMISPKDCRPILENACCVLRSASSLILQRSRSKLLHAWHSAKAMRTQRTS